MESKNIQEIQTGEPVVACFKNGTFAMGLLVEQGEKLNENLAKKFYRIYVGSSIMEIDREELCSFFPFHMDEILGEMDSDE